MIEFKATEDEKVRKRGIMMTVSSLQPVVITEQQQKPKEASQEYQLQLAALKDVLDSSTVTMLLQKNLKPGETVSISADGKEVLAISKQAKSRLDRFREVASLAVNEASKIIQQDPAFAFKTSALLAKEQVFQGIPNNLKPLAESALLPTIRIVGLILDAKKLGDVMKSGRANKPDKIVSIAHIVTDVAGAVGAAMMIFPGMAQIGTYLTVAGLMGDVGSFGYSIMRYFENKGEPIPQPK